MTSIANSDITVKSLTAASKTAWDAYVHAHEQGSFFHLSGWQAVLENGLNMATHFVYAERDNVIVGIYPLAEVKSWLFGHQLVALPFCVYGGILADDELVFSVLDQYAQQLAIRLEVGCLEIRNRQQQHPEWAQKNLYVTFRRVLSGDAEADMNAIPRKQRAMIRKGIANGLTYTSDSNRQDFLLAYDTSVRNLGTPVFPRPYFRELQNVFGHCSDILTVRHHNAVVASVWSFYFRDEVLPYYGGGLDSARALAGNDFMYWSLMEHAGKKGSRLFDFGRSKIGTGAYSFKKNWGFDPQALHYEYFLVCDKHVPEVNPNNPKYKYFIEAWKRLPLPVARTIGPFLSRYLG